MGGQRTLDDLVRRQHDGAAAGITSVCSAHPLVLRAAVEQARADGDVVLIEATSNQVDQFGGYTGMRPADFRSFVHDIADSAGLPRDRVILGGDHLGTNTWRAQPAAQAMTHACDLVAAYVKAGFTKIHLDCSYSCADDDGPPSDEVVAARSAQLLQAAHSAADEPASLRYVIGTEVPVPGGADHAIEQLSPTSADAARATLEAHRKAFAALELGDQWSQVMGLVVQPGVEFDHLRVVDYDQNATESLRHVIDDEPRLVFEAHSTDYQTIAHLSELVEDHWAVLKVGPGLTFALREALYALAAIEDELVPRESRSSLPAVVEQVMLEKPDYWASYYPGNDEQQRLARTFSYSDRVRYYWPDPRIQAAQDRLVANLRRTAIPLPLLSAYLPDQYTRVRNGALKADPIDLAVDRVRNVLRGYARACQSEKELS